MISQFIFKTCFALTLLTANSNAFNIRSACIHVPAKFDAEALYSGAIDMHVHALPPAYIEAVNAAGGDPSGFPTPSWSPEFAISEMDELGIAFGVLSLSTPGVPIAGTGQAGRKLARTLNTNLANYSTHPAYAGRFGFFGALPDWRDIDGTIAEIEYLYQNHPSSCLGVGVYTSYGGMTPGNDTFRPIWAALQKHKSLVFLHPGVLDVVPLLLGHGFPQPTLEYPLATTRAAVDLVISGTFRAHPDIDIILPHAGGTLPFIADRVLLGIASPGTQGTSNVTADEAAQDLQRFYLDLAFVTSPAQYDGILDFTSPDKILFGTDSPYRPESGVGDMIRNYETFVRTNVRGSLMAPDVLRCNSLELLAKHSPGD
jgi:6-methylsalicylate decarboxylase